uniref:Uncharacterized protein n=2 Tax=Panagrolaimus sp. ES5 TaxID=591445 RepID=A0AC34GSG1_9BILA
MTSEEINSHNIEHQQTTKKCGQYCSRRTTNENYTSLNNAVNFFLLSCLLLIVGCLGSFTWIWILAFTGIRTSELSLMCVLFCMQLFVGFFHALLLKRKTQIFCMISIVLDLALALFLIVLISIIVIKNGIVINPQVRTLPINFALLLVYIFAFFGNFNLLRFLHSSPKHWIKTKIFGPHSLHFSATNVHEVVENYVSEEAAAVADDDDYDIIEIKSAADNLSSENESHNFPRMTVGGNRQQAGRESIIDETYPEEKNPFAGEIEVEPQISLPIKEDSTQGFTTDEKVEVSDSNEDDDDDDEPTSVYLIDVQHILPQYQHVEAALPLPKFEQEKPNQLQQKQSRQKRPMKYMAHFHDENNQNRIMLPDGTFVIRCPWDPHQINTDETSPRTLHPNSSVILNKSPVPSPIYLERADFISLLPNTKV